MDTRKKRGRAQRVWIRRGILRRGLCRKQRVGSGKRRYAAVEMRKLWMLVAVRKMLYTRDGVHVVTCCCRTGELCPAESDKEQGAQQPHFPSCSLP